MQIWLKFMILGVYGSQANFAMKVRAHESKVSQVIHDRRKLTEAEARQWSRALRCDPSKFAKITK